MEYNSDADRFPVRKRTRMKDFDYASNNYYFVTVCTHGKKCLFGRPAKLSPMGRAASECLQEISAHFPGVVIDKWVVMPNHVHAIIVLSNHHINLSTVVGQYKSAVTKCIRTVCPDAYVWQTSFHDHVIRTQRDYERIWLYIEGNPSRWLEDCFYMTQPEI